MSGIPAKVREIVLQRDGMKCVSCGLFIDRSHYSIHHRVPRGMGGSNLPWINAPGNLLTLCGTGTSGCHGWVESSGREQAYEWGYLLHRYHGSFQSPARVKVLTADGWMLFDDDGGVDLWPMPNWSAERQAEFDRYVTRARAIRMGAAA